LSTSALTLICTASEVISEGRKDQIRSLRQLAELHTQLLTRNHDAPYGRRWLDRSQLQDLVLAPADADGWPIGLPEIESVAREIVLAKLATNETVDKKSGEWVGTYSRDNSSMIYLRIPLQDFCMQRTEDFSFNKLSDIVIEKHPLVFWMLYPSTLDSKSSPIFMFHHGSYERITQTLMEIVNDSQRLVDLGTLRRSILGAAAGGAGAELLMQMLPPDILVEPTIVTAPLGSALGVWFTWFLQRSAQAQ
jgi:hypothetical protein